MGCGRKKLLLGRPCLAPLLFLTVAVLAQTQSLSSIAEEPVGVDVGFRLQLGKNSTEKGRRQQRATILASSDDTSSSSSSSAAAAGPGGGTSVRDQIDRGLARAMVRSEELGNASDISSSSSRSSRITRYYRLYSRCSSKHLRIAGRHVDTLALPDDIYSELQVQTLSFDSQLTIQGSRSMNYLCFNKKGRLTIKHSGHERCIFHELHSLDHFTQFQSTFNPDWMIGFGRKGQRLHGDWRSRPQKQHRCFQFVKTDFPYLGYDLNQRRGGVGTDQRHGPSAGVPPLHRRNLEQQLHSVSKLKHSLKT